LQSKTKIKEFNYSLTSKIELLVGVWKGSVIDIETTGLNPKSEEIVTFGFIEDNRLQIIQRTSEDKTTYYNELK
jgi:uncharacterized protein YprB with RNaseH-like and TPR domain